MSGGLRDVAAVSPAGTPTMMGAMTVISLGIFNSAFHSAVFSASTAKPMTHVPKPYAHAASIRFSAASQQSASTNGPVSFPQMMMSVPAL